MFVLIIINDPPRYFTLQKIGVYHFLCLTYWSHYLKIADDKQLFSGVNDEVKLEVNDAVNNYMIV